MKIDPKKLFIPATKSNAHLEFLELLWNINWSDKEQIKFINVRATFLSTRYPAELDLKYALTMIAFMIETVGGAKGKLKSFLENINFKKKQK